MNDDNKKVSLPVEDEDELFDAEIDAEIEAEIKAEMGAEAEVTTKEEVTAKAGEKDCTKRKAKIEAKTVGRTIFTGFKWALFIGSLLTVALCYLIPVAYFTKHYYPDTVINGIDCSEKNVAYIDGIIDNEIEAYVLTIAGRDGLTDTISAADIGLHCVVTGETEKILKNQNPYAWFTEIGKKHSYSVEHQIEYNEQLLKERIDGLAFYRDENIVAPKEAYIERNGTENFTVVEEVAGTQLKDVALYPLLEGLIDSGEVYVDLDAQDLYVAPGEAMGGANINEVVQGLNAVYSTDFAYVFGKNKECVNQELLADWVTFDWETYELSIDDEQIAAFVDQLANTYNTYKKKRKFVTSEGNMITLKGGKIGFQIDKEATCADIREKILSGAQGEFEPVYTHRGPEYGEINDLGNTYIEINLSKQHLWVYQNGEVTMECSIVSGNMSNGCATPAGVYAVFKMSQDTVLKGSAAGESWETPVSYWMPFNGSIGMHDATWRRKFGKEIYLTNGSHGCVNLPKKRAKFIFEMCYVGLPVVLYYEDVAQ